MDNRSPGAFGLIPGSSATLNPPFPHPPFPAILSTKQTAETMSRLRILCLLTALWAALPLAAPAEGLTALARLDPATSRVADRGLDVELTLGLSQPVPWRVFTLDDPRRLVLDLSDVTWGAGPAETSARITDLRTGAFRPGWSRLVLDLATPLTVETAELATEDHGAVLTVRLSPATPEAFAAAAGAPPSAVFRDTRHSLTPRVPATPRSTDRPVVVLDPGHGGIDPGAEAEGLVESHLVLTFARELKEQILRSGLFDVAMTRDEDVFVPLETRITLARAAGADLFISLHADALAEGTGSASGATVYTLSDTASDAASRALAERHDRGDLLAGVDLSQQSDEIALVLMDLARIETAPRAEALAESIVTGFREAGVAVNSRPHRSAAFSVLKSADFPSVLVEIGFLSSARDRARLADPAYRAKAAEGLTDALAGWALADAARAHLVRQ